MTGRKEKEKMEHVKENRQNTEEPDFRTALGIKIVDRGAGWARGEMKAEKLHLNPLGIIHGGCLFSLADTVSGTAIMGYGCRVTTVNGSIQFLRPGKSEGTITAVARTVKHGKTFSVCDCQVFDDTDALIAATTMTFYHLEQGAEEKAEASQEASCTEQDRKTATEK